MTDEQPSTFIETDLDPGSDIDKMNYPYSSVKVIMKDSLGAIFLGILSVILMVSFLKALKRIRELENQIHPPAE
jgi:hypothetical protein